MTNSMKTLALLMQRHCENGQAVAEWLAARPDVRTVVYPGLASHTQHALAKRQMNGFGGMITAVLDRDLDGTRRMLRPVATDAGASSASSATTYSARRLR